MHDERDHGEDDQEMNESAGDVEREESQHPGDQEDYAKSKQPNKKPPGCGRAGSVPKSQREPGEPVGPTAAVA